MGAAALVLLLLTAGCSTDGDATETAAGPAANPAAARDLERYLRRVKREQDLFLKVQRAAVSANDAINTEQPDETWVQAARVLRQSRAAYRALESRLALVSAPARLATAHDGLVRSLRLFARYVDGFQRALATRSEAKLVAWSEDAAPTAERMVSLRRRWRADVERYAADIGVDPPPWVNRVGVPVAARN